MVVEHAEAVPQAQVDARRLHQRRVPRVDRDRAVGHQPADRPVGEHRGGVHGVGRPAAGKLSARPCGPARPRCACAAGPAAARRRGGRGAGEAGECGRGERGRWWCECSRSLLPPPPSPSVAGSSSVWWIAHHTIHRIPAIGILSISINQMKVQLMRGRGIVLPVHAVGEWVLFDWCMHQSGSGACTRSGVGACANPHSPDTASASHLDRRVAEMRHAFELADPRRDLLAGQARDALGAELLDVERRQRRAVRHRAAQQLARRSTRRRRRAM